jgi:hypothetical protein
MLPSVFLENGAARTIRQRWRNIFSSVRRAFKNTVNKAAGEFHRGEITEEAYLKIVGDAFEQQRKLVTLLSAGGIGRLSEQGLHKLDDMVRNKKLQFMESAVENIKRYQQLVQDERDARKEERRVKDVAYQKDKRAKVGRDVKTVLNKAVQEATSRNSKLNNYLRRRDPADPKLFRISSSKQTRIRQAFRSLFDRDGEDPFTVIFKMNEDTSLPREMQADLKELFLEGYGDVLRKIRGSENAKEIEDKMGLELMSFPHSYFDVGRDEEFLSDEAEKRKERLDNLVDFTEDFFDPVDVLQEIGEDKHSIEEGYRDGTALDLEENEKQLRELGKRVVYYRVTTSGDECPSCKDYEFDIFDTKEEALSKHQECYNVLYHSEPCYCEVVQAIVEEEEI